MLFPLLLFHHIIGQNSLISMYINVNENNIINRNDCLCMDGTGKAHFFCYQTKINDSIIFGQKFDCKWLAILKRFNLLDPLRTDNDISIRDPVFITGSSSNHWSEQKVAIATTQRVFPTAKIFFYDFGLDHKQIKEVANYCNVTYRTFNFSLYPQNVKNMFEYRWKPIIIAVRKL